MAFYLSRPAQITLLKTQILLNSIRFEKNILPANSLLSLLICL